MCRPNNGGFGRGIVGVEAATICLSAWVWQVIFFPSVWRMRGDKILIGLIRMLINDKKIRTATQPEGVSV